jgi:hypothetical protein
MNFFLLVVAPHGHTLKKLKKNLPMSSKERPTCGSMAIYIDYAQATVLVLLQALAFHILLLTTQIIPFDY